MFKIAEGKAHAVFQKNPGYVRKFPKVGEKLQYNEALEATLYFGRKFGNICPPTRVVKGQEGRYTIVQKKISGTTLKETKPTTLHEESLAQLGDFVNRAEQILNSSESFDYIGFQGDDFIRQRSSNKYIDSLYKTSFLFETFFRFWSVFSSTNLMLDDAGKIYYTDNVGELRSDISKRSPMRIIKVLLMKKYKLDIAFLKMRKKFISTRK